jgi:hypothetical protein
MTSNNEEACYNGSRRHLYNFKYIIHMDLLYNDECKTEQAGLEKTGDVLGSSLTRVTALVTEVSMVLFGPFRKIALGLVSSRSFII